MTRQKSGVSMLSLQGMLGLKSYKTVWTMSHKIRKAMADRDAQYQLTGLVETFRAILRPGAASNGRDDSEERPGILVTVEKRKDGPGFAAMRHIPSASLREGDVASDEERNSDSNVNTSARYEHGEEGLSDNYNEVNPVLIRDRKPTRIRWARILMANLVGNIRGVHHGVSEKHLHRYTAEFLYRFNRRAWSSQLLNRALTACVSAGTITYAELKI